MPSANSSVKPLRKGGLPTYRRQKYSGHGFYLTVLVISIIAAFSLVIDRRQPYLGVGKDGSLQQRGLDSFTAGTSGVIVRRDQEVGFPNSHLPVIQIHFDVN